MFNLVKYRFIFLLISLIVIVPGTLSLLVFHLNLSTDFLGGSSIDLRPQRTLTSDQITSMLAPLHLQSLVITMATNTQLPANKTAWVKLNTVIDDTVQGDIKSTLTTKYGSALQQSYQNIPQSGGQPFTLITLSGFTTAPTASDIQAVLKTIPNTDGTTAGSTATATPTVAATPAATATAAAKAAATATVTAQAAATAAAKATTTPAATATAAAQAAATATATATTSTATIPVHVEDVQIGTTTSEFNILTLTDVSTAASSGANSTDVMHIQAAILKAGGPYVQVVDSSEVGGSVAAQTIQDSILAVIAASVLILLFVWFSFRKVPKAWRYGACAIIALLHDVLVVLGIFSILGKLFNIQIDSLFITALLTVVGFSVHDTIVVFDRIRENMQRRTSETFEEVVNASLLQTMARSLNTSLTVLFTLLALTLFTNDISASVHNFTLALLIGIFSGTYSSIFNASMLLVIWEKGELGLGRFDRDRQVQPRKRSREERELAPTR